MSMTREEMMAAMAALKAQQAALDAITERLQEEAAEKPAPAPKAEKPKTARRSTAAPAARVLAKELGIDIKTLTGTGKNGCITPDDVRAAAGVESDPTPRKAAKPAVDAPMPPVVDATPAKPVTKVKPAKALIERAEFVGHHGTTIVLEKYQGKKKRYVYATSPQHPEMRVYGDRKSMKVFCDIMRHGAAEQLIAFVKDC